MKYENIGASAPEQDKCRALAESFHVNYTTDEDGKETENLTHKQIINSEKIEERGDSECGWVLQLVDEQVELLISTDEESGWSVCQFVTPETCDQLSDMFARVADTARQRLQEKLVKQEAEKRRIAELDARQGSLLNLPSAPNVQRIKP